ncbi:hypothetical protein PsYK624_020810 [Phanerochaete sordida]|uniref:Uncharacterized protein n=1 Tax=Phanerochaete sordida TaxID=48140 RepID=A0A9P3G0J3_9APHY|nr:hypothetical protein PsYK624_020810 [Phanerochaete sordida]
MAREAARVAGVVLTASDEEWIRTSSVAARARILPRRLEFNHCKPRSALSGPSAFAASSPTRPQLSSRSLRCLVQCARTASQRYSLPEDTQSELAIRKGYDHDAGVRRSIVGLGDAEHALRLGL